MTKSKAIERQLLVSIKMAMFTNIIIFQLGSPSQHEMDAMLQTQEKACRELECVICLEVPRKETQIFSCPKHHLMCFQCNDRKLESCPVCRQNFRGTQPTRNLLAEKMIEQLT